MWKIYQGETLMTTPNEPKKWRTCIISIKNGLAYVNKFLGDPAYFAPDERVVFIEHAALVEAEAKIVELENKVDPLEKRVELDRWRVHELQEQLTVAKTALSLAEQDRDSWKSNFTIQQDAANKRIEELKEELRRTKIETGHVVRNAEHGRDSAMREQGLIGKRLKRRTEERDAVRAEVERLNGELMLTGRDPSLVTYGEIQADRDRLREENQRLRLAIGRALELNSNCINGLHRGFLTAAEMDVRESQDVLLKALNPEGKPK